MNSLRNLVALFVGFLLGMSGLAMAAVAQNPVPAWMNNTCVSETDTDCFMPNTNPDDQVNNRHYVKVFRYPGHANNLKCVTYVNTYMDNQNNYCVLLDTSKRKK